MHAKNEAPAVKIAESKHVSDLIWISFNSRLTTGGGGHVCVWGGGIGSRDVWGLEVREREVLGIVPVTLHLDLFQLRLAPVCWGVYSQVKYL